MNNIKNLNMKLSVNNNLPNLKNLINKGKMDSSIENMFKVTELENNKFLSNKKTTKITQLIITFNFKLESFSTNIYTFTNKSYKQINKNLHNLYIICKSAFLNMSSIISKPIIEINFNIL